MTFWTMVKLLIRTDHSKEPTIMLIKILKWIKIKIMANFQIITTTETLMDSEVSWIEKFKLNNILKLIN